MYNHTYHSLYLFQCLPLFSRFEVFSSHRQKHPKESMGSSANDWRHLLIHLKVSLNASKWATARVTTWTCSTTVVHQQVWFPHPAWKEIVMAYQNRPHVCRVNWKWHIPSKIHSEQVHACSSAPTFQRHTEKITGTYGGHDNTRMKEGSLRKMGVRSPIFTDEPVVASAWWASWAEENDLLNMKDLEFEQMTDGQFHIDS